MVPAQLLSSVIAIVMLYVAIAIRGLFLTCHTCNGFVIIAKEGSQLRGLTGLGIPWCDTDVAFTRSTFEKGGSTFAMMGQTQLVRICDRINAFLRVAIVMLMVKIA